MKKDKILAEIQRLHEELNKLDRLYAKSLEKLAVPKGRPTKEVLEAFTKEQKEIDDMEFKLHFRISELQLLLVSEPCNDNHGIAELFDTVHLGASSVNQASTTTTTSLSGEATTTVTTTTPPLLLGDNFLPDNWVS